MGTEFVFTNARIALADEIVDGWIACADGLIVEVGSGKAPDRGIDVEGDLIMPGLVELHTDNIETHLKPRPKVHWPELSAALSFDAQICAAGITTVFVCLRAGQDIDYTPELNEIADVVGAIRSAGRRGLLRAEHRLHLRCEVCSEGVVEEATAIAETYGADLISLMDHTPGTRQFTNLDAWRIYYGGKSGRSEKQLEELAARKREQFERNYAVNRKAIVAMAAAHGIVLASHDDATPGHVEESIADQVALAEFPTTHEAARLSHAAGICVMMGAPNVVRGGSHSGNIAAEALARDGLLDALSSDYVPASLLMGAFDLDRRIPGYGLARALRTVTLNPAQAAGLTDRGEIAVGKRADLVRVHTAPDIAVVREVYREGRRVV